MKAYGLSLVALFCLKESLGDAVLPADTYISSVQQYRRIFAKVNVSPT
jgi:hypothetical protein